MKYELVYTPNFKRDLRQAQKRNLDMDALRDLSIEFAKQTR